MYYMELTGMQSKRSEVQRNCVQHVSVNFLKRGYMNLFVCECIKPIWKNAQEASKNSSLKEEKQGHR